MALPSQVERQSEIGRSYVYGQKQHGSSLPRKVLIGGAVLVVAAGSVWGLRTILNRKASGASTPESTSAAPAVASSLGFQPETTAPTTKPVSTPSNTPSTPVTNAPALVPPSSGPQVVTPRITPAGTPSNASNPSTSPSTVPATTPTSTAAPGTTPSTTDGRPTPVDVTRKDLTPSPSTAAPASPGAQSPASLTPTGSTAEVVGLIQAADQRIAAGDLPQARNLLSKALRNPNTVREDQDRIREKLTTINATLLFSPKIAPGDTMAEEYVVKSGDNLIKITRNRELAVDWRLLERINGVKGNSLKVGQKLKLVRGPFHAIVHKGDYRLDLFQGSPDDPDSWVFIRSFKVGLGTGNSTPVGNFVIKPKSKLINPPWVNPQTGQKFAADDPKNPIGEYWMGIEGVGESKAITGYGLHGTVEPDSIGQQKSMGCVRLGDEDVKLLYEMLVEQFSVVKIVP